MSATNVKKKHAVSAEAGTYDMFKASTVTIGLSTAPNSYLLYEENLTTN